MQRTPHASTSEQVTRCRIVESRRGTPELHGNVTGVRPHTAFVLSGFGRARLVSWQTAGMTRVMPSKQPTTSGESIESAAFSEFRGPMGARDPNLVGSTSGTPSLHGERHRNEESWENDGEKMECEVVAEEGTTGEGRRLDQAGGDGGV
jgi:hypothetical protein